MPFVKRHRDYYKYDYKDWTQPVLSSNTGYGTLTSSGVNESQCQPYSALNGVASGAPYYKQGWISGSSTGWWKWELPTKLSISAIKFYNPYSSTSVATTGQFFIDEGVTPLTESFSTANSSWASYNLTVVNDTPTDIIYFKMTGGGANGGIGELTITAQEQISIAGIESDHDYYIDKNKMYQLAAVKRSYYKYGTELNASIVGNFARLDKGVASGFSTSQYLKVPTTFNPENNAWNLVLKFNIKNLNYQYILGSSEATDYGAPLVIGVGKYADANGKLLISISSTSYQGNTVLSINTDYWVKVDFTGTVYNVYLSTTGEFNGEENLETSISSAPLVSATNIVLGTYRDADGSILYGSIDLSQSYISINGERWWSGDSYTKVGSWIDNGVVGRFSSSNYTRLPFTFEGGSYNNWELVTKIKVNSYSNGPAILCVNSSYGIFNYAITTSGRVQLALSTSTDSWNICDDTGEKVLDLNTWYWYKAEFTGTAYNTYWSIDGKVWNLDSSVQKSTKLGNISALNFGIRTKNNDQILDGYIDMQKTYFKANGVDVWHGTKVVLSTEADADYYTDNIINHSPMTSKTKYYKYAYQDWEQPVLTENGTMGADKFAVNQSSLLDSSEPNKAWNAFDGIGATTRWHSAQSLPAWISWYNPNPLKISNVEVTNRASSDGAYPNAYQLQYSDDNSTWVTAVSGKGASGNGAIWNIPVEHDTFHKYWRLYITSSSGSNSGYTTVGEIVITAQEQITVETTSSDYDWYERRTKMY